jgi:hypothetical protein
MRVAAGPETWRDVASLCGFGVHKLWTTALLSKEVYGRLGTDWALSTPMFEPTHADTNRLQCVECGRVSREDERDWTARLTYDDEVVVYCPTCESREFHDDDP